MTRTPTILSGLAIVVLAAAIAAWFVAPSFAERFTMPVIQSFTLSPGHKSEVSFVPRLSDIHLVGVVLDGSIPANRLDEIVGSLRSEPTARPDITLALTTGGATVSMEQSRGRGGNTFDIASFKAQRGHSYTLMVDVRDAAADLRQVPARLFVAVDPLTAEHVGFIVLFARCVAAAIAIVASVIAIALHRSNTLEWPNQAMQRTAR